MAHICHVTVLNPTQHPRIFYKLALSQSLLGHRVSIIGQDQLAQPYISCGVNLYPLPHTARKSIKRISSLPYKIWVYTRYVQADVYWIHTPELMWLGWYWAAKGKQVVYDMHEDYAKTLDQSENRPVNLKKIVGKMLRFMEKRWVKRLDAVVYAEACYDNVLDVSTSKKWILLNKFSLVAKQQSTSYSIPQQPYLLYTGTLSVSWGIWQTIHLWEAIRKEKSIRLIVAGFSYNKRLIRDIGKYINQKKLESEFQLIGGNTFVPHTYINALIRCCWAGTALYQLNPAIQGKVPTKFYEYMAYNKPLIFTKDPFWNEFNDIHQLGCAYHPDAAIKELITCCDNWQVDHAPESYSWKTEEYKLSHLLNALCLDIG